MRAKRSKRYRRIMSKYTLHFSFRHPYQVLCSGDFLRQCHAFHMPVQKSLENTLHGDARPYITQCSLSKAIKEQERQQQREQRGRGQQGDGADGDGGNSHKSRNRVDKGRGDGKPTWLPPPTEVPLRYCKHKDAEGNDIGVVDEVECLVDLVAGQSKGNEVPKNKNHYVLATAEEAYAEQQQQQRVHKKGSAIEGRQNTNPKKRKHGLDERDMARRVPGVPIVYVKRSVMVLEELSAASERFIRGQEKDKFKSGLVGDVRGVKRKRHDDHNEDHEGSSDGDSAGDANETKGMGGPKIRGKKKKAKGPNPLSVLKKKTRPGPDSEHDDGDTKSVGNAEGQTQVQSDGGQKKKRRRKHGKNNDGGGDGDGGDVQQQQQQQQPKQPHNRFPDPATAQEDVHGSVRTNITPIGTTSS